ncbi:hypothetical protein RR48_07687 [Papilio machaon]|uniref:Uncharacterized protein n=1 Tax=Papilio machaon TaxID=76193 RepID=A0A194QUN9_PAPMA|nr:hypothetical protein RR48_07687 [Papilio machaon]
MIAASRMSLTGLDRVLIAGAVGSVPCARAACSAATVGRAAALQKGPLCGCAHRVLFCRKTAPKSFDAG